MLPRSPGPGAGVPADRREISFGLLGVHAVSITYREGSQPRTQPVLPGLGADLIVQRYTSGRPLGSVSETDGRDEPGNYSGPAGPNGALTAITYNYAGRTCVDRGNLRMASCGLSEVPPPSPAALPIVHEPLHAHVHIHDHVITSAQISFHAPYPVTNAEESYSATAPGCHRGLAGGGSSNADVAGGGLVTISVGGSLASACGRAMTFTVYYVRFARGLPQPTRLGRITIHEPPGTHPYHYRGAFSNRRDGPTRHAACTQRFISRSCPRPARRATPPSCSTPATRARSDSRLHMRSPLRRAATTPGAPNTRSTGSPPARPAAVPKPAGASDVTSRRTKQSDPSRWGCSCSRARACRARASKLFTETCKAPQPAHPTNRSSSAPCP